LFFSRALRRGCSHEPHITGSRTINSGGFRCSRSRRCDISATTTDKNVSKPLQDSASTGTDQTFLKDPCVNKFFRGVVALLDEVLEDSGGSFLRAFAHTGNTRTTNTLTKAPCNGFGIDLGGKPFTNSAKTGDTQGAAQGRKRFDYRCNLQGTNAKTLQRR
jgi:hypothetical protein